MEDGRQFIEKGMGNSDGTELTLERTIPSRWVRRDWSGERNFSDQSETNAAPDREQGAEATPRKLSGFSLIQHIAVCQEKNQHIVVFLT